ncbi:GntR family transcriptional regulator [Achromobacter marplatensis]|uniref:GntR family transcriptional regulator n=1 Tax=Achromobacter marplatensis TaxID=470868 RepID=UPI0039F719E9
MTTRIESATQRPARGAIAAGGKQTQTTLLLNRLRTGIVRGQMPPGERLVVSALADMFQAGQTPVREALMRLVSEGLVVLEDQRGFSVASVSPSDLQQLTAARAEIEGLLARWSVEQGDDAWEASLLGSFHLLRKASKVNPVDQSIQPAWEELHSQFHATLVGACDNEVLLDIRANLYKRAERYRQLSVRYLKAPRDDMAEHQALADAALARDSAKVEALVKEHIQTTSRIILAELVNVK